MLRILYILVALLLIPEQAPVFLQAEPLKKLTGQAIAFF